MADLVEWLLGRREERTWKRLAVRLFQESVIALWMFAQLILVGLVCWGLAILIEMDPNW